MDEKERKIEQFFYDIATYANENWKCYADMDELFQSATAWYESFRFDPNCHDMQTLLGNLKEDVDNGSETAKEFYDELIGMINGKEEV